MDHWRPRQIPGNNCPTCSVSHFPFCPPPPMYYQNPRFPFDGDPPYQRPSFNSFAGAGSMGIPTPLLGNRNDGFITSDMCQSDNNWDQRDLYGQSPFQYQSNCNSNGYVGEAERNLKRPRVADLSLNSGSFDQSSAGISSEHERRLKLIRDHGGGTTSTPEAISGHFSRNQNGFLNSGNEGFQQSRYDRAGTGSQPYQAPGTNGFGQEQHMSQHVNSSDNYYDINKQSQGKDYMYANGHSYPPMNHWQGMNIPHHEHSFSDGPNNQPSMHYGMQYPAHPRHDQPGHHARTYVSEGEPYHPHTPGGGSFPGNVGHIEASHFNNGQPPLPATPPPPLPSEPPCELKTYFLPPKVPASLFPFSAGSSSAVPSPYTPTPDSLSNPYLRLKPLPLASVSSGFAMEEPSKQYLGDTQPLRQSASDKAKVVDAFHLFKQPHRANRPDHIVVILRGLPGSGKSYLAKMLRDFEVENGGNAPRIHSMDDYFMTEVEKTVDENEVSKSSNSVRPKKLVKKKVMEYCYEPEMEEAYRSSMLKAFKKTVEEGSFTFIIVDDRNLRVADFAQFWATAKRSGYEVYILEATYKDPAGCTARNVHNFMLDDIEKMAKQWEEAPSMYMQLDIKSLFHGDDLKENRILEVDMDMEDEYGGDGLLGTQGTMHEKDREPPVRSGTHDGFLTVGKEWDAEGDHPAQQPRELGKSKWSEDFDDDVNEKTVTVKGNINALSGLICAYGKEAKSVRWSDQVANIGFSIGALNNATTLSLVIGPGAGYNLKSNPLPKDENSTANNTSGTKRHNIFQEQIRAECASFKAVFDKRRHRIGGLALDD